MSFDKSTETATSTTIISVSNLTKKFDDKIALNDVSFTIEKGAPIALVGPNGAGKTTLFSILCGYIKPSTGNVAILGHKAGSAKTFGKLAALPQDAQLDPRFSIAHQLKFYAQLQGFSKKESLLEAKRTLELVGLTEVLNQKPEALSHGMRKRVAIAQALIGSPEVVMLDEATAGLDPIHAREVREIVAELSKDITFILSSHDLSELERLCDRVLYLENGKLHQHQAIDNGISTAQGLSYITLRMNNAIPNFEQAFSSIEQIVKVENTQDKEYLLTIKSSDNLSIDATSINTAPTNATPIDIQLLTLCHKNQWLYRQLINGKTLENQLFN